MILDLRCHSGIDWYTEPEPMRPYLVHWWQTIRLRELVEIGAFDATSGRMRVT